MLSQESVTLKGPHWNPKKAKLSIEDIKEVVDGPLLSDEKAEEVRNHLRALAEIIYEKWTIDRIE